MSHIALTGAGGFLGWHTRCAALSAGIASRPVLMEDRPDLVEARLAIRGASRVIHIASSSMGISSNLVSDTVERAVHIAQAIVTCEEPPPVVIYARSADSENGPVRSEAEVRAGDVLAAAAGQVGADFTDVELPTVFGEHEVPRDGSLVAGFCHLLANGENPTVSSDRELRLLHAQDAADILLELTPRSAAPESVVTVSGIRNLLSTLAETYSVGELPSVQTPLERSLFHTFRSYALANGAAVPLRPRVDRRGSLVEVVRSHGGASHFSFSTTHPGHARANHFHRRKIERIVPVAGSAVISMRRLFHDDSITVRVDSHSALAVDVPTLWTHRIENDGSSDLHLVFWADALLDRDRPDTYEEAI